MTPKWLTVARKYIGTAEIPGPKNNPTIMGFAARIGGWVKAFIKSELDPWCGSFAGSVLREALPGIKLPANPLGARNYASWGHGLPRGSLGALLVFERPGGAHVGFYVGEDATCFHVLGGNQKNSVRIDRIEKNRLVKNGIRWPPGAGLPVTGQVWLTAAGKPSVNEA